MLGRLARFKRDENGSIAILFAMVCFVVFGVTGLAIDVGRAVAVRSRLQAAVDAAALSAVRGGARTDVEREAAARTTFLANARGDDATASVVPLITADGGAVSIVATAQVPTTIGQIVGIPEIEVSAEAAATPKSGKQLELSMMIDLTGSMGATRGGQTKIDALKDAADDLLAILFPDGASSSDSVRVAVAPFADYVNAGQWAPDATGLPTHGDYNNRTNLKKTKQATFFGRYTGAIQNTAGSQCGATSPTSPAAGQTYVSGHCANPETPAVNIAPEQATFDSKTYPVGYRISSNCGDHCNPTPPSQLQAASDNARYWRVDMYDNYGDTTGWRNYDDGIPSDSDIWSGSDNIKYPSSSKSGYYIPIPASVDGVTYKRHANGKLIGVRVGLIDVSSHIPPQFKKATAANGYMPITGYDNSGFTFGSERNQGYFLPVPESMSTPGGVLPQCTTTPEPQGKLITCVTERSGTHAYTDEAPSSGYVGAFNHGNTSVQNYSEDGACYVAGRELPPIIPLTNEKSDLTGFFASATIGGATPGHLGTAWAWYMLSPKWSSVFTGASQPTPYGSSNVMKVAVLMTDGEYNIHYTTPAARDQALALCSAMKDAGIKIYTVGFGFSPTATASSSGTTEQRAKDLLQRCASGSSNYFFPYDGDQLRRDFQAIGSELMGTMESMSPRITN